MAKQQTLVDWAKGLIQDTEYSSTDILNYMNEAQDRIAGGIMVIYPDGTQVKSSPLPNLAESDELTTSTSNAYISMPSDYSRDLHFLVSDTNDIRIEILSSLGELLTDYPNLDNTSRVSLAAVSGAKLYYQGMPSTAETLTAYYYRDPYDMDKYQASTISFTASTSTIGDTGNGLSTFYAGQTIDITSTVSNNAKHTVATVASDGSSLTVSGTLVDESAGTTFTIQSRPDGIPTHLHESLLVNYTAMKVFERKSISDPRKMEDAKRCKALFNQAMFNLESSIERVPESIEFKSEVRYG
jgi:hypothetical protein